jgi:SAM-dependent methyltransferase
MRTSDLPTAQTLAFVRAHAPPPPARVREVGCGDGALASRLQGVGYRVVAVDSSEAAVAAAVRRGLDARAARWPDFEESSFDLVLFTRSLHHIHPLDGAVARARHLLARAGRVLVEDFAFNEVAPLAAE